MNSKLKYVFALVLGCVGGLTWSEEPASTELEVTPKAAPEAAPEAAPKVDVPKTEEDSRGAKKNAASDIVRAQFTTAIKNKEPIDELTVLPAGVDKVYFFAEARNLNGQSVIHRWVLDGKPVSEVKINVGSNRWRMWSSKELKHKRSGQWAVELVSASGEILVAKSLNATPKASSRNDALEGKKDTQSATPSNLEIQPNQEMQPSPETTPTSESN